MTYRFISIVSFLGLGFMLALLAFFNPADTGGVFRCPVAALTGLRCPGCGTMRALHLILHGEVIAAFRMNCLSVLLLPVILVSLILGMLSGEDRLFGRPQARTFIQVFIIVLVLFTVVRNIIQI